MFYSDSFIHAYYDNIIFCRSHVHACAPHYFATDLTFILVLSPILLLMAISYYSFPYNFVIGLCSYLGYCLALIHLSHVYMRCAYVAVYYYPPVYVTSLFVDILFHYLPINNFVSMFRGLTFGQ